jgi:hypothetical protein
VPEPAIQRLLNRAARYHRAGQPIPTDITAQLDEAGYLLEALDADLSRLADA